MGAVDIANGGRIGSGEDVIFERQRLAEERQLFLDLVWSRQQPTSTSSLNFLLGRHVNYIPNKEKTTLSVILQVGLHDEFCDG